MYNMPAIETEDNLISQRDPYSLLMACWGPIGKIAIDPSNGVVGSHWLRLFAGL